MRSSENFHFFLSNIWRIYLNSLPLCVCNGLLLLSCSCCMWPSLTNAIEFGSTADYPMFNNCTIFRSKQFVRSGHMFSVFVFSLGQFAHFVCHFSNGRLVSNEFFIHFGFVKIYTFDICFGGSTVSVMKFKCACAVCACSLKTVLLLTASFYGYMNEEKDRTYGFLSSIHSVVSRFIDFFYAQSTMWNSDADYWTFYVCLLLQQSKIN